MTTGARENGGVSERQNTSMLKATRELLVVSNLLVTERMTETNLKIFFALRSKNATCLMAPSTLVSDGKAY